MKSDSSYNRPSSFSRRLFGKNAAASAAIALLPSSAEASNVSVSVQNLGAIPEGLSLADWDEVYAKYSNLLRVYGKRLSVDEKQRLKVILTTNQHMLVSIRSFEVQNGDTSACTLRLQARRA
jgi:hypothetical protein